MRDKLIPRLEERLLKMLEEIDPDNWKMGLRLGKDRDISRKTSFN